jgi:thiosulfate/3-mercaptopyruvate sulfurtransferase
MIRLMGSLHNNLGDQNMSEKDSSTEFSTLVETDWLEQHLDDPSLRILECTVTLNHHNDGVTIESGYEEWTEGHIPGSSFVDLIKEISDVNAKIRFTLPSAAQFAEVMSRLGLGEGTQVVLYDRAKTMWAARLFWMLRYFGFDRAAVLNGGWTKWTAEGRPVSQSTPRRAPGKFEPKIRPGCFVAKKDVVSALNNDKYRLLYALDSTKYDGQRIPGSQIVTAETLLDPETGALLPLGELKRRFSAVNAFDGAQVITYCGSGIAASLNAFALHLLGKQDVSVYDGSLMEWVSDESLPVETW